MPAAVQVSANLNRVFETGNLGAEAFGIFWDAFSGILWDPERLEAQKSVVRPPPAGSSLPSGRVHAKHLARHAVMSAYKSMQGSPVPQDRRLWSTFLSYLPFSRHPRESSPTALTSTMISSSGSLFSGKGGISIWQVWLSPKSDGGQVEKVSDCSLQMLACAAGEFHEPAAWPA